MKHFAAAALVALASQAHAADLTVTELFASLAKRAPTRAAFVETKYLALLDRPVESRGELVFTPPDRMEKRTLAPKPERVVVDRRHITLERAGKTFSMGLHDNPAVAVLVESVRATLAGDLGALTQAYSASVSGDAQRWKLVLRPLDPAVATLVERVEIGGTSGDVQGVEIFQADGDRSVMAITPAPGG